MKRNRFKAPEPTEPATPVPEFELHTIHLRIIITQTPQFSELIAVWIDALKNGGGIQDSGKDHG
jgi:hypothetical protein